VAWKTLREEIRKEVLIFMGSEEAWNREIFRMSMGEEHFSLAKSESFRKRLLELLERWLVEQGLGVKGLLEVQTGQPLRLRLIRQILVAAEDPDREFLREAEEGLPVGVLFPLPRTPHVFEEQTAWPLDKEPWDSPVPW
jgi:hypothetical protein